jgi:hypothetical protein
MKGAVAEDGRELPGDPGGAGDPRAARRRVERRRPTVARFRYEPDPRRLRELLVAVDGALAGQNWFLRRRVRFLVGEVVGRLVTRCPEGSIRLDLELKADSVRIDIAQSGGACDFWEALDDVVFSDLTSAWGRDRRAGGGAWFEIAGVTRGSRRSAAR